MKKVLMGTVALAVLASNAMAWWTGAGKIERVDTRPDGNVQIVIQVGTNHYWKFADAANKKELLTIALTAMAADRDVDGFINGEILERLVILK